MKHIFKERTKEKRKVITSGVGSGSASRPSVQTIICSYHLLTIINGYDNYKTGILLFIQNLMLLGKYNALMHWHDQQW